MKKVTSRLKRGFTLIELLVVISIIGLLSSIVLASLSSARQKAKNAAYLAELKQLVLALKLYKEDNGSYPGSSWDAEFENNTDFINALVPDYIPSLPTYPDTDGSAVLTINENNSFGYGYKCGINNGGLATSELSGYDGAIFIYGSSNIDFQSQGEGIYCSGSGNTCGSMGPEFVPCVSF